MLSEYGTGRGVLGAGLGRAPAVCALDERAAAAVEAIMTSNDELKVTLLSQGFKDGALASRLVVSIVCTVVWCTTNRSLLR